MTDQQQPAIAVGDEYLNGHGKRDRWNAADEQQRTLSSNYLVPVLMPASTDIGLILRCDTIITEL
ncbi:unnamed protein product [Fusarium graminearum]|uniref:Chromosome 1, complete genome n=2 Tax=Gibberella zeae TaxID=5518 RepID=A0A098D2V3_GIBZE|nr:unnamed protein product [Fusarium graminearum]CAG1961507.1 unnamed protein product [Fusarium graminearum]CAG1986418.1 unnamed protein product [Fusarium graminearum]CEF72271.1 unnamed protein product [Fusarium graminearum]CZS75533.1 unnamed protein product [Fusarium graminearum]